MLAQKTRACSIATGSGSNVLKFSRFFKTAHEAHSLRDLLYGIFEEFLAGFRSLFYKAWNETELDFEGRFHNLRINWVSLNDHWLDPSRTRGTNGIYLWFVKFPNRFAKYQLGDRSRFGSGCNHGFCFFFAAPSEITNVVMHTWKEESGNGSISIKDDEKGDTFWTMLWRK